jgi:hypothetical protein
MKEHTITPSHIVCGNCGIQLKPDPLHEEDGCRPLELIVQDDDRIRELQYQAVRAGLEPRHSLMIAANWGVAYRPTASALQPNPGGLT